MTALPRRRLLLIGGAAGAGKTTTARCLAEQHGYGWLQADTIWEAFRAVLPEDSPDRRTLDIDDAIRGGQFSIDTLLIQHIAAAAIVARAVEAAAIFELRTTHTTLVVDGAWLLPAWMDELASDELVLDVRSVIIHEPDPDEVKRAMRSRSDSPATLPHQAAGARLSARYGDWLRDEALVHGVPVVEARPRPTLAARAARAFRLQ